MIENGILAEALVAHVLIAIRRPHATLWPSANLCAPITLDRSTLADWIRRAAFTLRPVHTRLLELLKRSTNLFADETTTPVLDPGRRQERAALGVCVTSGLGPATLRQALPTSRALVDPNLAPVRALPRDERELFIAASNSHVLAFDNLSGLPPWLSDTLCRLTSGGAFSTRRLFTDQDEILFAAA
jgi:hypothetical protein